MDFLAFLGKVSNSAIISQVCVYVHNSIYLKNVMVHYINHEGKSCAVQFCESIALLKMGCLDSLALVLNKRCCTDTPL